MNQNATITRPVLVEVSIIPSANGGFVGQAGPWYEVFGAPTAREVAGYYAEQTARCGHLVRFDFSA